MSLEDAAAGKSEYKAYTMEYFSIGTLMGLTNGLERIRGTRPKVLPVWETWGGGFE